MQFLVYDQSKQSYERENDVIIIGGSAAGFTAAIYTARSALRTIIITKEIGGQIITTPEIENYPGFVSIAGSELVARMEEQVRKLNVPILEDVVEKIDQDGEWFLVHTSSNGIFKSRAVIIATGRHHRKLNVPGEKEFAGKGVSYCVTCDGPFFKDKVVVVIGGGNSGFTAAEYMAKIAKKVYLVHRRETFKAEEYLVKRVLSLPNIEVVTPYVPVEIYGSERVEGIKLKHSLSDEMKELSADGVFVEIGTEPNTSFVSSFVELNSYGEIKVNRLMHTSREGVFACGDVTDSRDKQIAVAVGEGCVAGLSAKEYLYEGERKGKWKILGAKE